MSLTTLTHGKQQYTLLSKESPTSTQQFICSYGLTGAILTTDLDALILYTRTLALSYPTRVYSISTVSEMQEVNSGIKEMTIKTAARLERFKKEDTDLARGYYIDSTQLDS